MSQKVTSEKAIEARIIEDLKKSGFASEIYAEHTFSRKNWYTDAGNYYFDLDESKVREYDLHALKAWVAVGDGYIYTFRVNLVGEVKKSESPWVVIENLTIRPTVGRTLLKRKIYREVHGSTLRL